MAGAVDATDSAFDGLLKGEIVCGVKDQVGKLLRCKFDHSEKGAEIAHEAAGVVFKAVRIAKVPWKYRGGTQVYCHICKGSGLHAAAASTREACSGAVAKWYRDRVVSMGNGLSVSGY